MLIKWIKKKILKSIIKDITNELPNIKAKAIEALEIYKDELLEFCKKKLKEAIEEFVKSRFNKAV